MTNNASLAEGWAKRVRQRTNVAQIGDVVYAQVNQRDTTSGAVHMSCLWFARYSVENGGWAGGY